MSSTRQNISIWAIVVVVGSLLVAAGFWFGGSQEKVVSGPTRQECLEQLDAICENEGPICFKTRFIELSPGCQKLVGADYGTKVVNASVICQQDLERLCPVDDKLAGKSMEQVMEIVAKCIQQKRSQLSAPCQQALQQK